MLKTAYLVFPAAANLPVYIKHSLAGFRYTFTVPFLIQKYKTSLCVFNTAPSWYVLPLPDIQLQAIVVLETAQMGIFHRVFPY